MDAETIEGHHSVWSLCQKTRQAKGASRRITGGDGGEGRQEARWREERGFTDWTRARLAVLGLQPLPALALHQQLEVWNLVYKGRDETRRRRGLASNPDTLFLPRAHHPDESDGQLFQLCLLFIFSFLPSFLAHLPFLADFFFPFFLLIFIFLFFFLFFFSSDFVYPSSVLFQSLLLLLICFLLGSVFITFVWFCPNGFRMN